MHRTDSAGQGGDTQPVSFEKLKKLNSLFDEQLNQISEKGVSGSKENSRGKRSGVIRKLLLYPIVGFLLLLLPFVMLIRSSVYFYLHYQLNGWIALAGGIAATVFLLIIYMIGVSLRYRKKARIHRGIYRGVIVLVIAYSCYSLLYLSGMNVKQQELRSHYRNLHPILRVAVTTAILADSELIITDIQRTPEDYEAMGLASRNRSHHFQQSSGYVHAVDIRTVNRAEWKNWMLQQSARLLGFRTLRHTGTADHLHVSLPLNES